MEFLPERVTTGGFLSTNSSIPAWKMENGTLNGSDETSTRIGNKKTLILEVVLLVTAVAGLPGNAAVLWLLGFRMRRNAFSVYILNLAGADFLFLCCQVVVSVLFVMEFLHLFSTPFPVGSFLLTVAASSYIVGLSTLSAVSTERCLSILWPIWYRCRRPRHLSAVVCALLWALSLPLSILEMYTCRSLLNYGANHWCQIFNFVAAGLLILAFLVLSASSLALLLRILCSSRRFPLIRLYVTILLTVLVFLLCGLPCGINWALLMWNKKFPFNSPPHFYLVTLLLSCVNSSVNPIIYVFVGSFRQRRQGQTLKQVLQRALQDTPEVGESGGSLPQGPLEMSGSSRAA
nr:mas-related G-protein coupled receptor member X2-like [Oryctolagus cuniculus]